jgi:hypothetical protein
VSIEKLHEQSTPRRYTVTGIEGDRMWERVQSAYCEDAWLPFLGPTALVLARRLDARLASEARVAVEVGRWADALGVEPDDVVTAFHRLLRYGLAEPGEGENHFRLLRHWPTVPPAITTMPHRTALMALKDL